MLIYMVRHGESEANAKKIHAGWAQVPLTEKGKSDAQKAGETLKKFSFDKVYSSDLLRSIQTAKIAFPEKDAVLTEYLREISVGEISGKSAEECVKIYGDEYIKNKANKNFRFCGGECHEMHLERVRKFFKTVCDEGNEKVLAFCHEWTIHCMIELTVNKNPRNTEIRNGGVYEFEYTEGNLMFRGEVTA